MTDFWISKIKGLKKEIKGLKKENIFFNTVNLKIKKLVVA